MSEKKNKGWNNLKPEVYSFKNMDKDKLKEISRKGAKRMLEVKQERRTAKQCLADILSLEATPEIIAGAELDPLIAEQLQEYAGKLTMYDLINLVAVGQAAGGNMRAAEFVRDSVGDMPVKSIDISGIEVMTEADRQLMEHIYARLEQAELTVVADNTAAGGEDKEGKGNDN